MSEGNLRLFLDMQGGISERFRAMPIARSSVRWAHVLTSLAANSISRGDCLLMGFRSAPALFSGSLSTSEELGCPATETLRRSPCVLTARQPREAAAHR
jgi:hypothetical protein